MYQKSDLDSGIRILSEKLEHVRSVTVGVWLTKGSRHEPEDLNGVSHLIEHMVFKGTENRSAREIAIEMDVAGGKFDAFTSREYTCFYFKVLDEHLPTAVELTTDIILNPAFKGEHLKREKQVVSEEIKKGEEDPGKYINRRFVRDLYKDHPLGRPVTGTMQSLRKITKEDISNYFRKSYVPGNLIISVAGKSDHSRIVDLFSESFEELDGKDPYKVNTEPVETPAINITGRNGLEQAHIILGGKAYRQNHPKKYALHLLNSILGGSMSSRLFQKIRENEGLAYGIRSFVSPYSDGGYFGVYAGTGLRNVPRVIELILKELRKIKDGDVSKPELDNAKSKLKGGLMLSSESSNDRMMRLALQEYFLEEFISLDEVIERIEAVTMDEVLETARDIFVPEQLALNLLGGEKIENLDIDRSFIKKYG